MVGLLLPFQRVASANHSGGGTASWSECGSVGGLSGCIVRIPVPHPQMPLWKSPMVIVNHHMVNTFFSFFLFTQMAYLLLFLGQKHCLQWTVMQKSPFVPMLIIFIFLIYLIFSLLAILLYRKVVLRFWVAYRNAQEHCNCFQSRELLIPFYIPYRCTQEIKVIPRIRIVVIKWQWGECVFLLHSIYQPLRGHRLPWGKHTRLLPDVDFVFISVKVVLNLFTLRLPSHWKRPGVGFTFCFYGTFRPLAGRF